jgi:hypothetical protein
MKSAPRSGKRFLARAFVPGDPKRFSWQIKGHPYVKIRITWFDASLDGWVWGNEGRGPTQWTPEGWCSMRYKTKRLPTAAETLRREFIAAALRDEGVHMRDIGSRLGVSSTYARNLVGRGRRSSLPLDRYFADLNYVLLAFTSAGAILPQSGGRRVVVKKSLPQNDFEEA